MERPARRSSAAATAAVVLATVTVANVRPARAEAPACFPTCRSGYLCHEGACVSACNPPCGVGETCTSAGECVPPAPPPSEVLVGETLRVAEAPPAVDAGWARGASYFGAGTVAADVAITAAVMATNPQEARKSRALGALGIVVFGVTAPLTALGGASARVNPAVKGYPVLRIASWTTYALTLASAAVVLSRSHAEIIKDSYILGVGVLGTASTIGFAVDAWASASQAERLLAGKTAASSQPTIGLASGSAGGLVPTWGWVGTF